MVAQAKRGGRRLVVVIVAACLVVYGSVVALYAFNAAATTIVGCTDDPPETALLLSIDPQSVDAVGHRIDTTMEILSLGPVRDPATGLPREDLTIVVTDTDGPRSYAIERLSIPSPVSLRFLSEGAVERWPFDRHVVTTAIAAYTSDSGDGGSVPILLCGSASVAGWTFSSDELPGDGRLVIEGEAVPLVQITADRSAATVAFGFVILALMIVLPVLGLTVAIQVYRGRRKAEATLMSWVAAMLFATLPLRGFLPGSPPIGSWVDYLVVLWVVVGLVASLVVYALGWLRWAPRGEGAQP